MPSSNNRLRVGALIALGCVLTVAMQYVRAEDHYIAAPAAAERIIMPPTNPTSVESADLYTPMLKPEHSDTDPLMAKTLGEGMALPGFDEIKKHALPRNLIEAQLIESLDWIQRIIQPAWLPPDLPTRLHAMHEAVAGRDAFIGAWNHGGRIFQVVVTKERIHLLTRSQSDSAPSDREQGQIAHKSLALAYSLLALKTEPDVKDWTVRPLGNLVFGYRHPAFARNWDETLIFVTDGRAHKFSVLKYLNRSSPIERSSAIPRIDPWFPRQ